MIALNAFLTKVRMCLPMPVDFKIENKPAIPIIARSAFNISPNPDIKLEAVSFNPGDFIRVGCF